MVGCGNILEHCSGDMVPYFKPNNVQTDNNCDKPNPCNVGRISLTINETQDLCRFFFGLLLMKYLSVLQKSCAIHSLPVDPGYLTLYIYALLNSTANQTIDRSSI